MLRSTITVNSQPLLQSNESTLKVQNFGEASPSEYQYSMTMAVTWVHEIILHLFCVWHLRAGIKSVSLLSSLSSVVILEKTTQKSLTGWDPWPVSFSAFTLFVEWQQGHMASKKLLLLVEQVEKKPRENWITQVHVEKGR